MFAVSLVQRLLQTVAFTALQLLQCIRLKWFCTTELFPFFPRLFYFLWKIHQTFSAMQMSAVGDKFVELQSTSICKTIKDLGFFTYCYLNRHHISQGKKYVFLSFPIHAVANEKMIEVNELHWKWYGVIDNFFIILHILCCQL